jgi:uncharacterized protein (TIGR02266 family)
VERKLTGLSADEHSLSNFDSELASRERALHGKERAVDDRRQALASREESLRLRARALVPRAKDLGVPLDGEVRSAAAANTLEAPLAEVGRSARIAAINARRQAPELRETAVQIAEDALGNIESVLADAEGVLRRREQALQAFAAELERHAKEAAERARRQQLEATQLWRAPTEIENATTQPSLPTPAKSESERRIHRRIQVDLDVTLSSEHNFFTGFVQNISEGGLFIATHEYLDVGSELDVTFRLPSGQEVRTRSRVQWIREYNPDNGEVSPGMGVRFLDISSGDQSAVMDFLRQREPLFFEQ